MLIKNLHELERRHSMPRNRTVERTEKANASVIEESFKRDLARLINQYGLDSSLNVPDFQLAELLNATLNVVRSSKA